MPVISANRLPATFLNIRLGTSIARLGSPVPRYMSSQPSLSKSAKLHPIVAKTMSRPASLRLVFESLAVVVPVQPVGVPGVLLAQQAADDVFQGQVVRSREDVDPAVVVVVPRPAGEAGRRPVDAQLAARRS